ncbi:MAG: MFS transporter [Caldilineaceae bacterium]
MTSTTVPNASAHSGWGLTVAGLSHFTLELCHNFLPVLYPLLLVSMDLTYAQIGVTALIVGLVTSLPQPFLGFLSDRLGPYRVGALSILWIGVLMGLVGFAPHYFLFTLLVGFASLGSAAYHPAGAILATMHSRARRGAGMSIFSVGGNLGSAMSPLLLAALLPWFGLKAALVVVPIALVVGGLLYAQHGPMTQRGIGALEPSSAVGAAEISSAPFFRTALILLTIAAMTRAWFQVSLITYLPVWIEAGGGTVAQASQLLSIFSFAIGGGAVFGGTISDRVGPWYVVVISFFCVAPAYWIFLQSSGLFQYLAIAFIGFAIGNTYPTFVLMAQDCWPQRAAVASGLIMGIGWAPGGLGSLFTGYLADLSTLTYSLAWLVVPPVMGLGCVVVWRRFVWKG